MQRRRGKKGSKSAAVEKTSDPMGGCKIYVMDLAPLAEKEGRSSGLPDEQLARHAENL